MVLPSAQQEQRGRWGGLGELWAHSCGQLSCGHSTDPPWSPWAGRLLSLPLLTLSFFHSGAIPPRSIPRYHCTESWQCRCIWDIEAFAVLGCTGLHTPPHHVCAPDTAPNYVEWGHRGLFLPREEPKEREENWKQNSIIQLQNLCSLVFTSLPSIGSYLDKNPFTSTIHPPE